MLFVIVGIKEKKSPGNLPDWIVRAGGLCFGVYLLQQFIMVALYRHTQLPNAVGFYLLPWVGFIITLVLSVAGSFLLRLTRVGRFLI